MASFESFYGGRQGASFTIVKRFDGLDIPEKTYYRCKWCAKDADGFFYVPLIEKDAQNYTLYPQWGAVPCDGVTTVTSAQGVESEPLPVDYQEGMRQCFAKGGDSTNQVNYGEYVIIDTLFGLGSYHNPDNGKVFMRGMNYDYNAVTNPLCGAEYIGQIVGPQGSTPELFIDHYDDIVEQYTAAEDAYTVTEDDLLPGSYLDPQTSERKFHDDIQYAYATILNPDGSVRGCTIGFKIPFTILDFEGRHRSPYYQAGDNIPPGRRIGDIITEEFEFAERIDDGTHPYYEKWKFNIPQGIKGDTIEDLEVYPTSIKANVPLYEDSALTILAGVSYGDEEVDTDVFNPNVAYLLLTNGLYASIENGWKYRVRYKQWDYSQTEGGSFAFVDIGAYNTIEKMSLTEDGSVVVTYTYRDTDRDVKAIPWVRSMSLDEAGHFKIVYNNDNTNRIVNTTGTETEGGVTRAIYEATLKTITNAKINTENNTGVEGSGSQKLAVEYSGDGTYVEIGQPINYVLDTHVVTQSDINRHPEDATIALLKGHICVYYSDTARRASSTITLYSSRLGREVLGWIDLGDIRGETNATLTFGSYPTLADIPAQPPEVIMGTVVEGVLHPDYRYMGWGATIEPAEEELPTHLALYDYVNAEWVDVGQLLDYSAVTPSMTIAFDDDTRILKVNGFVVDKSTTRKAVN